MASIVGPNDLQVFIGYFEEPEPGVPEGCTGWYHTDGSCAIGGAAQVFTSGQGVRSLVREEITGPFTSRQDAFEALQASMSN